MKKSRLMIAAAALLSTLGTGFAAQAQDWRRDSDRRYEQRDGRDYRNYRSDRDRRYDRRDRDRDRRYSRRDRDDRRYRDRRGYVRDGRYAGMAQRNYEYERDLQTCYRNGRRICP